MAGVVALTVTAPDAEIVNICPSRAIAVFPMWTYPRPTLHDAIVKAVGVDSAVVVECDHLLVLDAKFIARTATVVSTTCRRRFSKTGPRRFGGR